MYLEHYTSPYSLMRNTTATLEIPRLTGKEIAEAEQLLPDSRAAKRQMKREEKRKHKIRYQK